MSRRVPVAHLAVAIMAIMAVLPLALAAAPICPPDAKATFIQMGSDCHPTATPNAYCDISVYVYSLTVTLGPHANSDVSFSAYAQPTMDMTPAPAPDKQTCSIKPVPNNLPSSPKQFSPIRSSSSASLAAPSIPNSAGVEGGLVILTWGNGLAKSCKMVTGADGTVSAKVNYPPGATCSQVRTVFCPYTKDNTLEDGQTTMAECAGLADDNGKPITRLDWKNPLLKDCTGAAQNTVHGSLSNQDLGNDYRSSAESVTICNNQPSDSQTSFCWGLALVFGLLFSASFISGRNPLMFFDFGVARSVRMNRAAGAYTPITQNVSVNPASVLDAVDKAGSMVGAAVSSTEDVTAKEDIKDDKGNVVVKKGDVIKTAGEVKKDNMKAASKQGFVSKSVGDLVSAGSDSLYGAITFQSADKMKADRAEGKTGFSLMGAINTVGQKAMEGMVLGAAGVLAGGKFGKVAMTHAGKEAVSQGTRALSTGMSSGLEAMQKNIDLGKKDKLTGLEKEAGNLRNKADVLKKEAAGLWASGDATGALNKEAEAKKLGEQAGAKETQMAALRGPSDYDKASIMAGQLADVLHVDKSRLKVESSTMTNGYAVKLDGAEVGWVSRPNGQDGPAVCSYKDDSGVNWTVLDPSKSIDGFLNRYQAFGNYMSQGSFILINGRLEEMKGSAAFTNHVGSVIDSIGLFAQGKLNFFELLKTALMPVVGLGMVGANAFSSRGMPRIEEATRSVSYNDQTYYLTATGFYFKDKADGKLKQVGDYDPETGIITMTQDAGKKEDDKNGDNGDYLRNGWSYTISDSGVMTKITGQESGAVEKTVQQGKGVRTVSKPGLVSRALDKMDATLTSMFSFSEAGISGQGGMNILTPDGKEKKQKPASGVTVGMEVNLKNVNGGGVENLTFNVSVVNKGVNGEKDLVVLTCRDLSRNINLQVVAEAARSMDSMGTLEYKITSNDVHAIINRGTGFIIGEKGEKVVTNDQDMILGISNAGGAGIKNSSFTYHGTEFAISTSSWLSAKTKAFGNAIGIGDQQMSGEILYLAPKLNTDNFVAPTMMTIGGKNMEVTITTKSGVDSNASAGDKGANLVIATTIDQKTQYVLDNTKPDAPRTLAIIKRDEKGQAVAYLPDKNNPSKADEKTSVKEFTFRGSTYAIDGVGANLTQGAGKGASTRSGMAKVVIRDTGRISGAHGEYWKAKQFERSGDQIILVNGTACTVRESTVYDGSVPIGTAEFNKQTGKLKEVKMDYDSLGRKLYGDDAKKAVVLAATAPEDNSTKCTEYLTSSQADRHLVFDPITSQLGNGIEKALDGLNYFSLFGKTKPFGKEGGMQWLSISLFSNYMDTPLKYARPGSGADMKKQQELEELYDQSGAADYGRALNHAQELHEQEMEKWIEKGAKDEPPAEISMPARYEEYLAKRIDESITPELPAPFTNGIPYRPQDQNARHVSVLGTPSEQENLRKIDDPLKYSEKIIEKVQAYEKDLLKRVNASLKRQDPNAKPYESLLEAQLSNTLATTDIFSPATPGRSRAADIELPNTPQQKPAWAKAADPDLLNEMENYMGVYDAVKKLHHLKAYYEKQNERETN